MSTATELKRCPTCGQAVDSIFDHVDRDEIDLATGFCKPTSVDPRDPDPSREGRQGKGSFFCHHNCYRCKDGLLPCVCTSGVCEYPHARND